MGFINFQYISDKGIFFLTSTVVAIVVVGFLIKRMYGGRHIFGDHNYKHMQMSSMLARGAAALNVDTDINQLRSRIVHILAENTNDPNSVNMQMDVIMNQLATDLQAGGPLGDLIHQRAEGSITASQFQEKLHNYIRHTAAGLGIPLINTTPPIPVTNNQTPWNIRQVNRMINQSRSQNHQRINWLRGIKRQYRTLGVNNIVPDIPDT